ncbi:MAG: FAD-binding protein, partial [Deltaproteobacteria bacterium]
MAMTWRSPRCFCSIAARRLAGRSTAPRRGLSATGSIAEKSRSECTPHQLYGQIAAVKACSTTAFSRQSAAAAGAGRVIFMGMPPNHPLETFKARLLPTLGDRLRDDPEILAQVAGDASHVEAQAPAAWLGPRDVSEVSLIARVALELGIGLVPRGSGTGKAGGCVPRAADVVVDVSRMNKVLQLRPDDLYAVVQPGLVNQQLDQAAGEHGLMYPPDPASWESCSLGGNIATNAGGPRAVKYGVTQAYVWGLQVVLVGGEVLRVGRQCIKGVAGLAMAPLFVGSEGTLGIVTEATMHLVPAPRGVCTAWLCFASPEAASAAGSRIFRAGVVPRMLELLDDPALRAVRPYVSWPMPQATAALLVETDGCTEESAMQQMQQLCAAAQPDSSQVAPNAQAAEAMRRTRRLVSSSLKHLFPFKISDDIAVPRSQMPALLLEAQAQAQAAGLQASAYGHLGDGNLHINL